MTAYAPITTRTFALRPIPAGFRQRNPVSLRMRGARSYAAAAEREGIEAFRNRVFCADALEFMRGLPDNSVDAIISDPPYNLTELDFDQQPIDWPAFWSEARRVLKIKRSPVILFSQQPFTTDLINSNRKGFRYEIIWEKSMPVGFLDANRRPLRAHENVLLFGDLAPEYHPVMEISNTQRSGARRRRKSDSADHYNTHTRQAIAYDDNGKRYPTTVWKFAQRDTAFNTTATLHPTQKPLPLMEKIILNYTNPGDVILDPFAGSGSTGAAARNTGRDYILCENDPKHFATAEKRLGHGYTVPMFDAHPSGGEGHETRTSRGLPQRG
jgi:DNA modification methylase